MAGALMPTESVAMMSKPARDPYGLWELPIKALHEAGVNTDYVKILDGKETGKIPGFAIILVDKQGNNQIIGAPGITRDLTSADIDEAASLFQDVGANNGFLVSIGNNPTPIAKHIVEAAVRAGVRVLFDPGGADDPNMLADLLDDKIYLFKPNAHEAKALTGVKVIDLDSARRAAIKLLERGVKHVLITARASGAYLLSDGKVVHIPIPEVIHGDTQDETGCGDQVMATICASLSTGQDLQTAASQAILTGTLQFHRLGIRPVTLDEIAQFQQDYAAMGKAAA